MIILKFEPWYGLLYDLSLFTLLFAHSSSLDAICIICLSMMFLEYLHALVSYVFIC